MKRRARQFPPYTHNIRDRYGESAVALGSGLRGHYKDRVQDNPVALPGKEPAKKKSN